MSLWVDQLDPNDWFDLSIVAPDPPRVARHSFVVIDAIITQSLHMDRYPGLVTVMPQQIDSFDLFSVAYSFADFISGFDVSLRLMRLVCVDTTLARSHLNGMKSRIP